MHEQRYLSLCSTLARASQARPPAVGDTVARFYADLGAEEFVVLPGEKLLSLHTGNVKPLGADRELFPVFSVDELVDAILAAGAELQAFEFVENRLWRVSASVDSRSVTAEDPSLPIALALLCLRLDETLKDEQSSQGGRGLVTVSG